MTRTDQEAWAVWDELQQRWIREGWIGWNGGHRPVASSQEVDVRYRDGTDLCGPADAFVWRSDPKNPQPIDIVGYRVVTGGAET